MIRTAILVDGGFYRKRANHLWGILTAEERADELQSYCHTHIHLKDGGEKRILYRIFYYDCEPISNRSVFHPLTRQNIRLDQSDTFTWTNAFLEELKRRRKFALRLGQLAGTPCYNLKPEATKDLFVGKRKLEDITESDFLFHSPQKGVDMRIGIDIASLAYKKQVDQIILIAALFVQISLSTLMVWNLLGKTKNLPAQKRKAMRRSKNKFKSPSAIFSFAGNLPTTCQLTDLLTG